MEDTKFPDNQYIESLININKPIEEVKNILKEKSNSNLINNPISREGRYLAESAARVGNLPLVEYIVGLKPEQLLRHKPNNGSDLLQHAVVSGNIELVKWLISQGANPNYLYSMDTSILYFVMKYKHFDMLKYFIEELKMNPNIVLAQNGIQPIYMAMEMRNKEIFNYLLKFNPILKN